VVGQPRNRGTAPAVVYALLRLTPLWWLATAALQSGRSALVSAAPRNTC